MLKRIHIVMFALVTLKGATASGAPISRIHEIRSPLLNAPVIVQRGGSFDVVLAGSKLIKQITLSDSKNGASKVVLSAGAPSALEGGSKTSVKVPGDTDVALYDLTIGFADGSSDTQPHAVKVIDGFKKKFDFIHFTDEHFNTGSPALNEARAKFLESIAPANPELVLFSGDLGLNPDTYDVDYLFAYSQIVAHLNAPVYIVPGNHECYVDNTFKPPIDGMDYWNATYGIDHMSFDYGDLHVVGLNNFDWEKEFRDKYDPDLALFGTQGLARIRPAQWDWLTQDLKSAKTRTISSVAFMHVPLETFAGGRMIGLKNRQKISGPSAKQFVALMNEYGVSHVFVGHMHWNEEKQYGALRQVMTLTAGSGSDPEWGYRIVHVEDGRVTGWEVKTFAPSGGDLK
jgi:serine/threonine-protein phosphatase CPPED1